MLGRNDGIDIPPLRRRLAEQRIPPMPSLRHGAHQWQWGDLGLFCIYFFLPCGGEFGPSEFEMGHISSDSPPGPDGATTHGPQVACVRRENDQRNGERY
jgi:hypothetical protein